MSTLFQLPSLCSALVFEEDQHPMNSLHCYYRKTSKHLITYEILIKNITNPSSQGAEMHNAIWGGPMLETIPSLGATKEPDQGG